MRRHIDALDLVRIIGQQLAQLPPVVPVALFLEAHDPRRHRQHAMLAHQADRLAICRRGAALLDLAQHLLVSVLHPHQEAFDAGLLVEMQMFSIPHDVIRPRGADQRDLHILCDQRFEKALPGLLGRCRVLVGEIEYLNALLAMQPRDLGSELLGIAIAPLGPEAALAAIIAWMRTAARKLHDHCALAAPV